MVFKRVSLYDSEKYYETGCGKICKSFKCDGLCDEEIKLKIEDMKDEQRLKNDDFRRNGEKVKRINPNFRIKNALKDIKVKNRINLKLDKDTGNTIFIIGSSKMGKSTCMMHLYRKYFDKKNFISMLFSKSKHIDVYKDNNRLMKCDTFNNDSAKLINLEKFINSKTRNKYNFMNMLDDIVDVKFNKLLNEMIMTYRNSNISCIVSMQYAKLLAKNARTNINNIILFGFNTDESIEDIIKTYLKGYFGKLGLKSMDEKINFYRKVCENHGFIYLHPASNHISFHRLKL